MAWLGRSRAKIRPSSERNTLVHPPASLAISVGCAIVFIGVAVGSYVAPGSTGSPLVSLFLLGFAVFAALYVIECLRVRHVILDEGIAYRGLFRRGTFPWADIVRVRYSDAAKWFRVEMANRQTLRFSSMLMGLPTLAESLLHHVSATSIDPETRRLLETTAHGDPPPVWGWRQK
jgi:hypothetical protein